MANKILKDDEVIVTTGKDKGKHGKVLKVLRKNKLLVEDTNLCTHYTRPDPNRGTEGGLIKKEAPIDASNVAIVNSSTGKADKVGFKFLEDGAKVRYFKSNGEMVDV